MSDDDPTVVSTSESGSHALAAGTVVGRYMLAGILGEGGFGVTYRARDQELHRDVAIKEYLPVDFSRRQADGSVVARSTRAAETFEWGRARFVDEARVLARLERAAGIVRVYDILAINGTAYMIMELVQGETLEARLQRSASGTLPADEIERLLWPLLDGLERVHTAGFLHRDIKPGNILVDAQGLPTLIDFGAARESVSDRTQTAIYTPGYAPFEQFTSAPQGAWTDIYALGATLYRCVAGRTPPPAPDRMLKDAIVSAAIAAAPGRYAPALLAAVDAALMVQAEKRPQSIEAWRTILRDSNLTVLVASGTPTAKVTSKSPYTTSSERKWPRRAAAAAIAVGAISGGAFFAIPRRTGRRPQPDAFAGAAVVPQIAGGKLVAFSSDGRVMATGGSGSNTVRLWDVRSGRLMRMLEGHRARGSAIALAPDGLTLASGSNDGELKLWEAADGTLLRTILHRGSVTSIAFARDGQTLASASEQDANVKLWDVASGRSLRSLSGADGTVSCVAFTADRQTVMAASGKSVRLWDLDDADRARVLNGHTDDVLTVAVSSDRRTLASSSQDSTIRIWDITKGETLRVLEGNGPLWSVAFSPNGASLIAGSDDGLHVWDTTNWQSIQRIATERPESLAFNPENGVLAAGSDRAIKFWDTANWAPLRTLATPIDLAPLAAVASDGTTLAFALNPESGDASAMLWDLATGRLRRTRLAGRGHSTVLSMTAGKDVRIHAGGYSEVTVAAVWEAASGRLLREFPGHTQSVTAMAFAPDARSLATASEDGDVKIWEMSDRTPRHTLRGHAGTVASLVFSPDGRTLASGGADMRVRLWDATGGGPLRTLDHVTGAILALAFSADATKLAAGDDNFSVTLWEVGGGKLLHTLSDHRNAVACVAFAPDGRIVASASLDATVKLWDAADGRLLRTLQGHDDEVGGVVFLSEGRRLASIGRNNIVKLWDVSTARLLATGFGDESGTAWIAPDGRVVLHGDPQKLIAVVRGMAFLDLDEHLATYRRGSLSELFSPLSFP